jgi:hypothetical protein
MNDAASNGRISGSHKGGYEDLSITSCRPVSAYVSEEHIAFIAKVEE